MSEQDNKLRLTPERSASLLAKIDYYARTKDNNMFDSFYHADLDVFVRLIEEATMTPNMSQE